MGKKGGRKKAVDPFLKKEWYKLIAPSIFAVKDCGKTLITKTQGQKNRQRRVEGTRRRNFPGRPQQERGRLVEEDQAVRGRRPGVQLPDQFPRNGHDQGQALQPDPQKAIIIEANVDCRTTDGYIVRLFCIAFTRPQDNQIKATCYAKSAQIRAIRAKMTAIMTELGTKGDLKSLVKELISAPIGDNIARDASSVFPIKDCFIRKVKVLKKPKFDVTCLMEWHNADEKVAGDVGKPVEAEKETLAGSGGCL